MASVMIRCPNTGQAVHTGVGMPWEMFNDPGITIERASTECPACREVHVWDKKDAFPDS